MKKFMTVLCLGLIVPMLSAQETNEVQELKRQMQLMQEHFEKVHDEDRAGQERDRPPLRFLVPRDLKDGILVVGGDVEALYSIVGLSTPAQS